VRIWDADTGQELLSLPSAWTIRKPAFVQGSAQSTGCAPAWDPGGRFLALGDADGVVKTWSVGSGRRAVRSPILNVYARGGTWGADSRHLFYATEITADDVLAAEKKQRDEEKNRKGQLGDHLPPPPPEAAARPAAPGQLPLPFQLQKDAHPRIQVCDAITGTVVGKWDTKDEPVALAASPDGKWLAGATSLGRAGAGLLRVWPARGDGPATILEEEALLLSWSPDSKRLACSSAGQTTIRLWDPNTPRKLAQTLEGLEKPSQSLAWSPDGKRLASAGGGTVKVWDVMSGKPTSTFTYFVNHEPAQVGFGLTFVSSILSWSRDGNRLAVAGEDETVKIWDVEAQKELATLHGPPSNEARQNHHVVCTVAWSPDGKRLASVSPDKKFLLWDTATWQKVLTLGPVSTRLSVSLLVPSHAGTLAWSPDGTQLGFFGSGSVTIWDGTPEAAERGQ
jgi:WD40 repeat protein